MRVLPGLAILILVACSPSPELLDAAPVAADARADACAPIDEAGVYRCPVGCDAISGHRVDIARACHTADPAVLVCIPSGAAYDAGGAIACYEREGGAFPVWSSRTSFWLGEPFVASGPELATSQGWTVMPFEQCSMWTDPCE